MYSILGQDFLVPFVNRVMNVMEDANKLPKLKSLRQSEIIKPTIVVGLSALGRGHDLSKLDLFLRGVGEIFGPEVISQQINPREYMIRRAAAVGIDSKGLVKSREQLQAEAEAIAAQQQQAQAQPIKQELAKGMVQAEAKQMTQQTNQQNTPTPAPE